MTPDGSGVSEMTLLLLRCWVSQAAPGKGCSSAILLVPVMLCTAEGWGRRLHLICSLAVDCPGEGFLEQLPLSLQSGSAVPPKPHPGERKKNHNSSGFSDSWLPPAARGYCLDFPGNAGWGPAQGSLPLIKTVSVFR